MGRPKKEVQTFVLPTNPTDLQAIRDAIYELEGADQFIADKKEFKKDVYEMLEGRFGMSKDLANKLVVAHQKDSFGDIVARNSEFETTYEVVMGETPTLEQEED